MYHIRFYQDANGVQPVKEYLEKFRLSTSKDAKIHREKIALYFAILQDSGTRAGEKFTKYLGDGIWELRPLENRIFFFLWQGDTFVLLHGFTKKTRKTPKREIEQAKRNRQDFMERCGKDE